VFQRTVFKKDWLVNFCPPRGKGIFGSWYMLCLQKANTCKILLEIFTETKAALCFISSDLFTIYLGEGATPNV